MPYQQLPALTIEKREPLTVCAGGRWQVHALARPAAIAQIGDTLQQLPADTPVRWDLSQVSALDHIGAQWFWNAWGGKRPAQLVASQSHTDFFHRLEQAGPLALPQTPRAHRVSAAGIVRMLRGLAGHLGGFVALIGQ